MDEGERRAGGPLAGRSFYKVCGRNPTPSTSGRNHRLPYNALMKPLCRAYVYKLRPNRSQLAKLEEILETCRRLYNDALAERKEAWEDEQRSVGFAEQCTALTQRRKSSAYLRAVHSQVLQNTLRRVDRSFQNFFRRCKSGEKPGYPRFKGRGWYDSFC
jgi:putative transposase